MRKVREVLRSERSAHNAGILINIGAAIKIKTNRVCEIGCDEGIDKYCHTKGRRVINKLAELYSFVPYVQHSVKLVIFRVYLQLLGGAGPE